MVLDEGNDIARKKVRFKMVLERYWFKSRELV